MTFKGFEGVEKIKGIMQSFRENPIEKLGDYKVLEVRDYELDTVKRDGKVVGTTGLPKSDVLYFDMDNDAWLCVRPSGTEPKIKFYAGVKGTSFEDADAKMTKLKNELTALVK